MRPLLPQHIGDSPQDKSGAGQRDAVSVELVFSAIRMEAVVPAYQLITVDERPVGFLVGLREGSANAFPEGRFFIGKAILVGGETPTIGQSLQPGAFDDRKPPNNVLAVRLFLRDKLPFLAVARARALVVGGVQRTRLVAAISDYIGIVGYAAFVIARNGRAVFSISVTARIRAERVDDQFVRADILTVGPAPIGGAKRAHRILVADRVAVNCVERVADIGFPAAAVASCRVRSIDSVGLQRVGQERLLLHPRIRRKRAGVFAKVSQFVALILREAHQMTGARGAVFAFRAKAAEAGHPVAAPALVVRAGMNQQRNMSICAERMRWIAGLWIAPIDRAGDLGCIVDDRLIILTAVAVRGKRWEHAVRPEHALALAIPGRLADHAGNGIAARLRTQCGRALLLIADAVRLYALTTQESSTSSSASLSMGGSSFPRLCARRRMPSQAFLLK